MPQQIKFKNFIKKNGNASIKRGNALTGKALNRKSESLISKQLWFSRERDSTPILCLPLSVIYLICECESKVFQSILSNFKKTMFMYHFTATVIPILKLIMTCNVKVLNKSYLGHCILLNKDFKIFF